MLGAYSPFPAASNTQSPDQSFSYHPHLIQEAARKGIWPGMGVGEPDISNWHFFMRAQETYTISGFANPYFQHGDFDHDGLCDVAVCITENGSGRKGIIIIPGVLDQLHSFGIPPASQTIAEWDIRSLIVDPESGNDQLIVTRGNDRAIEIEWVGNMFSSYLIEEIDDDHHEPALLKKAKELGLWPEGIRYEILWESNPAYMRGDFNGDGEFDVAILVRDTSNREQGIVIIHSSFDGLHTIFPSTESGQGGGITNPTRILIIPKGRVLRPFSDHEPKDQIELTADAIWAGWPGAPYSGAWYLRDGRYHWVTLSD